MLLLTDALKSCQMRNCSDSTSRSGPGRNEVFGLHPTPAGQSDNPSESRHQNLASATATRRPASFRRLCSLLCLTLFREQSGVPVRQSVVCNSHLNTDENRVLAFCGCLVTSHNYIPLVCVGVEYNVLSWSVSYASVRLSILCHDLSETCLGQFFVFVQVSCYGRGFIGRGLMWWGEDQSIPVGTYGETLKISINKFENLTTLYYCLRNLH